MPGHHLQPEPLRKSGPDQVCLDDRELVPNVLARSGAEGKIHELRSCG
jgi:hypothetical protein